MEIQKLWLTVSKDGVNPHFKNKYATLDNIIEVYSEPLSNAGLVVYHTSKDNILNTIIVDCDDWTDISTQFVLSGTTPQQIGSSITYAKRYNLWQLLNIATDDDDDGNSASETNDSRKNEIKKITPDLLDQAKKRASEQKSLTVVQKFIQDKKNQYIIDQKTENEILWAFIKPLE